MKNQTLAAAVVIGVAVFFSVLVAANAFKNRNKSDNVVAVTGLAERDFVSDLIVWKSSFSVKNSTLTEAYAELKRQSESTRKFLEAKGIDAQQITFDAVDINQNYSYTYGPNGNITSTVFAGYTLRQQLTVQSNDVAKVENVSREITELINQGIEIISYSPEYYYTQLSDLKVEMLAEASKDGYERAKTIAQNGNGKLGKLVFSNMGVFQIIAQNSSEDYSWGGAFNTSSKNKTATITVRLSYQLK